jgi:2,4-dienoyl-CoA reductase-like NADH-dependent reductase (Old Yellow Enzyme family)/thioredoxin reductase
MLTRASSHTESRYVRLRESVQVNAVTIPNRIVRAAHGTGFASVVVSEALIAFHERRAAGGVGLIILGDGIVHPSARGVLALWEPTVVPGLRRLADAIHAHGTVVFQQLSHQGAAATNQTPPWSSSTIPLDLFDRVPVAMSHKMIDEVVDSYARSARHCRAAGLDGVEVQTGHGFLLSQFLSPLLNDRTDEYGGCLDNRMRFLHQILSAIRAEVGPAFPVGIRMSVSEAVHGGLEVKDSIEIAEAIEAGGLIDFFDLSYGHLTNYPALIGGMHEPHGYQLPTTELLSAQVSLPTIVTGRINTLDEAEAIVAQGTATLVSLTRATIADPNLVSKSFDGVEDDVLPCIACNDCVAAMNSPARRMVCAVNPSVGNELANARAARSVEPRSVLVVGAGPAGLEAARVAAEAGHHVVLCDAAEEPGGAIRHASAAPYRSDLRLIVQWEARQLRRLGVDLRLDRTVDIDFVRALDPDVVVVATGATPRMDGRQIARPRLLPDGLDRTNVFSAAEVHNRPELRPRTAVVVDDLGTYAAVGAAEQLAREETQVHLVTRFAEVAAKLAPNLEREPVQRRLAELGVVTVPHSLLESATVDTVTVRSLLLDRPKRTVLAAEALVLVLHPLPRLELVDALQSWNGEVHVIGDALAPRDLRSAIGDGNRIGSAIGRTENT